MPEYPNTSADDLFDDEAPLDAGQLALHGLLTAYFEHPDSWKRRIEAVLLQIRTTPSAVEPFVGDQLIRSPQPATISQEPQTTPEKRSPTVRPYANLIRHWRKVLAAAAAIIAALVLYHAPLSTPLAVAADHREAVNTLIWLPAFRQPALNENPRETEARVTVLRQELADLRPSLQRLATMPKAEWAENKDAVFTAWQKIIWELRDLKEWDTALSELLSGIELVCGAPEYYELRFWRWIFLTDLGDSYATLGQYEQAHAAYHESIDIREQVILESTEAAQLSCRQNFVVPMYWRLAKLEMVEGDFSEARQWLSQADALLREYFVAQYEMLVGIGELNPNPTTPPDAFAAYLLLPEHFRIPPDWPDPNVQMSLEATYGHLAPTAPAIVKLRGQCLEMARLLRLEGRPDEAWALITEQAPRIQYYASADESRLPFAEALETARIALLRNDADTAKHFLDVAQVESGPIVVIEDPNLDKPAVNSIERAELSMLLAVATLERTPGDESATYTLHEAAADLCRFGKPRPGAAPHNAPSRLSEVCKVAQKAEHTQ